MDAREQRGLAIAALCKLKKNGPYWVVPSQSVEKGKYFVNVDRQTCSCPDHREWGHKCKHIYAAEFSIRRETSPDGTVTETETITLVKKKTYSQKWSAYNTAQSVEKDRFQALLHDLCQGVPEIPCKAKGRKPHSVRDAIFAMAFKVYSTFSSRRFSSDLREAHERGYLTRPVPGMKVTVFMENPVHTPILRALVAQSARPLSVIETDFAVDSSGFTGNKFIRWFDHKYNAERRKHVWVKVHICCGVKTNVITAATILDKDAADSPQFGPLVKKTREGFSISEVSADKAYTSNDNFQIVADCGGTGFLPFKVNATGGVGGLFEKMFHYFQFRRDEFLAHYHKRSNVESTFSAVKRKFGDSLRSKTETAMVNEALCKLICHNICCLIQEQHELGIEPVFWKPEPPAAPLAQSPVA